MPTQTLEKTRDGVQRCGPSAGYEGLTAADPEALPKGLVRLYFRYENSRLDP